jgi:elongator complex protein 3
MITLRNYQFNPIVNKIIEDLIKAPIKTQDDLASFKRKVSKEYKVPCLSNIELLKAYHKFLKIKRLESSKNLENLLKTRPIRSLSGIVNISVLTKPYPCLGKCLYCPMEKGIPKSYVSGEPAVERAKRLNYSPYLQVKKRIEILKAEGHPTDKIELRIVGGTWSYYPKKYQNWFIKRCFDAANEVNSKNLKEAQRLNEKAKHRIVGLSIETRPDFISQSEIKRLRELGVTMVELGVQSIYDDVLKLNLRGHGVKEIISATKLLKEAGFKVLYQMMPNLPGSNLEKDKKMFEELFQNPDFQPDLLKIYPCALLKEAPLYKLWRIGKYQPYTKAQLIDLIKSIKKKIPYYVRIQRINRDIPSNRIVVGGAKISNLRQILNKEMAKEGWHCKCIRCREVRENYNPKEKFYLFRQDYQASGGREIFLSFENKKRTKLYSLLRLKIPSQNFFISVLSNSAIIREVHTYGELVPFGQKKLAPQHSGLGKKLIKEAEKIAKREFGLNKIAVISGVGVRRYFSQLGYRLRDTYMVKVI